MPEQNTFLKKLMLSIICLVVIGILAISYHQKTEDKSVLPQPVSINTKNQPTMGNPDAKIHIVAFEDLKCANCARFNNNVFPKIKKQFIDTGKAKYTFINLAFINGSMPAAIAARCVYQQNKQAFFPYIKYIYANQPPENENWANIPKLLDFATNVSGINTEQLTQCLIKSPYTAFIKNNIKIASKVMNNEVATPTLYVNGIIVKPLSEARIKTIINSLAG